MTAASTTARTTMPAMVSANTAPMGSEPIASSSADRPIACHHTGQNVFGLNHRKPMTNGTTHATATAGQLISAKGKANYGHRAARR